MSSTFFKLSSEKEFADVEAGTLKTSSCPSVLSWVASRLKLGWTGLCRHLPPSDVRVPLQQQHLVLLHLLHLLHSCSVARSFQAGGEDVPCSCGLMTAHPP